ncbi:hypothetical protein GCM10009616_12290 [Microlunatus lacustris]
MPVPEPVALPGSDQPPLDAACGEYIDIPTYRLERGTEDLLLDRAQRCSREPEAHCPPIDSAQSTGLRSPEPPPSRESESGSAGMGGGSSDRAMWCIPQVYQSSTPVLTTDCSALPGLSGREPLSGRRKPS